jgi:hypothetical protein
LGKTFKVSFFADMKAPVSTISGNVSTLTTSINAYTGSANQSLALTSGFSSLDASFKTAKRHADRSYPFNEADSENIANAITSLTPAIITLLSGLDSLVSYFTLF